MQVMALRLVQQVLSAAIDRAEAAGVRNRWGDAGRAEAASVSNRRGDAEEVVTNQSLFTIC